MFRSSGVLYCSKNGILEFARNFCTWIEARFLSFFDFYDLIFKFEFNEFFFSCLALLRYDNSYQKFKNILISQTRHKQHLCRIFFLIVRSTFSTLSILFTTANDKFLDFQYSDKFSSSMCNVVVRQLLKKHVLSKISQKTLQFVFFSFDDHLMMRAISLIFQISIPFKKDGTAS